MDLDAELVGGLTKGRELFVHHQVKGQVFQDKLLYDVLWQALKSQELLGHLIGKVGLEVKFLILFVFSKTSLVNFIRKHVLWLVIGWKFWGELKEVLYIIRIVQHRGDYIA